MKLPIDLRIEEDSLWTVYKTERNAIIDVEQLKQFVERWKEIYPFKVNQIIWDSDILQAVKTEKIDSQDMIIVNIILPQIIFKAMMLAKEYGVPLNCAFIQANGGIGNFDKTEYKEGTSER